MSNGSLQYTTSKIDNPFKGFNEELDALDQAKKDKAAKAYEMSSEIEMADSGSLFGGDYTYAQSWAEQLTQNLDEFSSSPEGVIQFQQATQQLSDFIDGREAYYTENFGTAKGGPQEGTFIGNVGRKAMGSAFEWEGGFIDDNANQTIDHYESQYMNLSQPQPTGELVLGVPAGLSQYVQSRPVAPFMPRLVEGDILSGFDHYAKTGPNSRHENANEAYDWALGALDRTRKLAHNAARDYVRKKKEENPSYSQTPEGVLADKDSRADAFTAWADDAKDAWVSAKTKDTARIKQQGTQRDNLAELRKGITLTEELPGPVNEYNQKPITRTETNYPTRKLKGDIDVSAFVGDNLRTRTIDNPEYNELDEGSPKNITEKVAVEVTPNSISITDNGMIILKGLGNFNKQSVGDVTIDPDSYDGKILVSQLNSMFKDAYGITFEDFLESQVSSPSQPEGEWSSFNP
jgi:hypothetical protein